MRSRNSRIFITFLLLLWPVLLMAQVKIGSWNLQNFGKTKSATEIRFMAETIKDLDLVAIQEVVAGYGGAGAVARLAEALNRTGYKWDYSISDPTNSSPYATERYAFLWKTSVVKRTGKAGLDQEVESLIDREPFIADFSYEGEPFSLVNFHAIPKKKQPETEIKHFKFFPARFPKKNLIFLGDFNLPQKHTVFNPLKKLGYEAVFDAQKTTMKMDCVEGECLASEYDNIFFNSRAAEILDQGVILFYEAFPDMVSARRISDHIPVWVELRLGEVLP